MVKRIPTTGHATSATREGIRLVDPESGASASLLPELGFNCYRFRVPVDGAELDILWSAPGFSSGRHPAASGGIPILFPYPGRIRGQRLSWQGRDYPLEGDDGLGNAIHGFVLNRPWRVLEQTENKAVGQFQASVDDPSLLRCWPSDFRITATYELSGTQLTSSFLVENPGEELLPFGLGTHPYFCLPLGGSSADPCRVRLPACQRWELEQMLPTGKKLPVDTNLNSKSGQPFAELRLDDVFTDLEFEDGWCTCSLSDPSSGITLSIRFDLGFQECVAYNPPDRQSISIEPLTCVPNAAELAAMGIDAGLQLLPPGEACRYRVVMKLESGS